VPNPEETAVVSDLHWLIHQGHVIEFANGIIETAKKPVPKPPKPEARPAATSSAPAPAQWTSPPGSAEPAEPDLPVVIDAQPGVPAQVEVGEPVHTDQEPAVETGPAVVKPEPQADAGTTPPASAESHS
jgi:hypothetical protein